MLFKNGENCYEQAVNEDITKIKYIINQVKYLKVIFHLIQKNDEKFICASRNLSVLARSALTGKGSVQGPRNLWNILKSKKKIYIFFYSYKDIYHYWYCICIVTLILILKIEDRNKEVRLYFLLFEIIMDYYFSSRIR